MDNPSLSRHRRKGAQLQFIFDHEAAVLLRALSPNKNGQGLLLSELIRREAERRAERPRLLAQLAALAAVD
jgi:hypothetical protein